MTTEKKSWRCVCLSVCPCVRVWRSVRPIGLSILILSVCLSVRLSVRIFHAFMTVFLIPYLTDISISSQVQDWNEKYGEVKKSKKGKKGAGSHLSLYIWYERERDKMRRTVDNKWGTWRKARQLNMYRYDINCSNMMQRDAVGVDEMKWNERWWGVMW